MGEVRPSGPVAGVEPAMTSTQSWIPDDCNIEFSARGIDPRDHREIIGVSPAHYLVRLYIKIFVFFGWGGFVWFWVFKSPWEAGGLPQGLFLGGCVGYGFGVCSFMYSVFSRYVFVGCWWVFSGV
jgi:hypothetical protein